MRILILNHEFPEMGSEASEAGFFLLREYAKNPELQIDYVTASPDREYHQFQMGANITIHRLPIGKKAAGKNELTAMQLLRFVFRAYKFSLALAKENPFDLSHALFSFPSGLAAAMLAWKIKLPYCLSLQESDLSGDKNSFVKYSMAKAWKNSLFIVAGNWKLAEKFKITCNKKEAEVIEGRGIDTASFFPDPTKRNENHFTVLCDSELVPNKGIRYLIQALKILVSRYPQICLVAIGDGSEKQSLQNLARGLEIDDKIIFAGNISLKDSLEYYQASDVFVLPALNHDENNEIATRRAAACALPIVATLASGVEELVVGEENGFLVALSTADDLAEKIDQLILDKNLRSKMAENSLKLARLLSWETIAEQHLKVYTETKNLGHFYN